MPILNSAVRIANKEQRLLFSVYSRRYKNPESPTTFGANRKHGSEDSYRNIGQLLYHVVPGGCMNIDEFSAVAASLANTADRVLLRTRRRRSSARYCASSCVHLQHRRQSWYLCVKLLPEVIEPFTARSASRRGKKCGPRGGPQQQRAQCTNCRASATSTESPSWFNTSRPHSGTSPDVLCETMIFLAINCRQAICEVPA